LDPLESQLSVGLLNHRGDPLAARVNLDLIPGPKEVSQAGAQRGDAEQKGDGEQNL
jgi:hypothetical protein